MAMATMSHKYSLSKFRRVKRSHPLAHNNLSVRIVCRLQVCTKVKLSRWKAKTRSVFCLVSANEIAFIEKSNFLFIWANSWLWHKPQIGWFTYSSLVNFFLPLFAATSRATVDKQSATAIKRFVSCPVGRYFPFLQSHDNARVNVWPNQKS